MAGAPFSSSSPKARVSCPSLVPLSKIASRALSFLLPLPLSRQAAPRSLPPHSPHSLFCFSQDLWAVTNSYLTTILPLTHPPASKVQNGLCTLPTQPITLPGVPLLPCSTPKPGQGVTSLSKLEALALAHTLQRPGRCSLPQFHIFLK